MDDRSHPFPEFAVAGAFLLAAAATLFWNLTRANQIHELGVAPAVLVLTLLSAVLTWRRVWTLRGDTRRRGWLTFGAIQGVVCAAASVGALTLWLRWMNA